MGPPMPPDFVFVVALLALLFLIVLVVFSTLCLAYFLCGIYKKIA